VSVCHTIISANDKSVICSVALTLCQNQLNAVSHWLCEDSLSANFLLLLVNLKFHGTFFFLQRLEWENYGIFYWCSVFQIIFMCTMFIVREIELCNSERG
jgi:hypothetical protein